MNTSDLFTLEFMTNDSDFAKTILSADTFEVAKQLSFDLIGGKPHPRHPILVFEKLSDKAKSSNGNIVFFEKSHVTGRDGGKWSNCDSLQCMLYNSMITNQINTGLLESIIEGMEKLAPLARKDGYGIQVLFYYSAITYRYASVIDNKSWKNITAWIAVWLIKFRENLKDSP